MALVSMFLCNQSYASHGRDFLLWVTILNSSAPFLVAYVTHVQTTPYEKNRESIMHQVHVLSLEIYWSTSVFVTLSPLST